MFREMAVFYGFMGVGGGDVELKWACQLHKLYRAVGVEDNNVWASCGLTVERKTKRGLR